MIGMSQTLARLADNVTRDEWLANPFHIPSNSRVIVQYGLNRREGLPLRRGHGQYINEYRVLRDSDDKDQWVDCWRCMALA